MRVSSPVLPSLSPPEGMGAGAGGLFTTGTGGAGGVKYPPGWDLEIYGRQYSTVLYSTVQTLDTFYSSISRISATYNWSHSQLVITHSGDDVDPTGPELLLHDELLLPLLIQVTAVIMGQWWHVDWGWETASHSDKRIQIVIKLCPAFLWPDPPQVSLSSLRGGHGPIFEASFSIDNQMVLSQLCSASRDCPTDLSATEWKL